MRCRFLGFSNDPLVLLCILVCVLSSSDLWKSIMRTRFSSEFHNVFGGRQSCQGRPLETGVLNLYYFYRRLRRCCFALDDPPSNPRRPFYLHVFSRTWERLCYQEPRIRAIRSQTSSSETSIDRTNMDSEIREALSTRQISSKSYQHLKTLSGRPQRHLSFSSDMEAIGKPRLIRYHAPALTTQLEGHELRRPFSRLRSQAWPTPKSKHVICAFIVAKSEVALFIITQTSHKTAVSAHLEAARTRPSLLPTLESGPPCTLNIDGSLLTHDINSIFTYNDHTLLEFPSKDMAQQKLDS